MNFNSRFFNSGFKKAKNNFKGFFNIKQEILNSKTVPNYYNLFVMNKIKIMNCLSLINSYKLTNSSYFLNSNNHTCNALTIESTQKIASGILNLIRYHLK